MDLQNEYKHEKIRDFPESYLSNFYEDVVAKEWTAISTRENKEVVVSSESDRLALYKEQMKSNSVKAKTLLESYASHLNTSPFLQPTIALYVKSMFQVAWSPCLAAFSTGLKDYDHKEITSQSLNGICHAIKISCIFNMTLERDAYIRCLARFTSLQDTHTQRNNNKNGNGVVEALSKKNIDCIQALITVALDNGNSLGNSWLEILRCMSQLNYKAQWNGGSTLTPFSTMNKEEGFKGTNYTTTNSPFHTAKPQAASEEQQSEQQQTKTDGASRETSIQAILLTVDSIFTQALEGDAVVHFLRALCQASREEILGEYFSEVGCSSKEDVALSVVDQLSEVSRVFLESELEMSRNLNFQELLRPFQLIMMNNTSLCIKVKVVQCVSQLVRFSGINFNKSGWHNIIKVFHLAATSCQEFLVILAFDTAKANIAHHQHHQFFTSVDLFQDWINCLSEFACNHHAPKINLDALSLITHCVYQVTQKQLTPNMLGEQHQCD
ncbi:hypothetical protein Pcinc_003024 [Petrolisthes cinctipes]|uniref:Mon2/Sec7/BIG1-like HDS domain-containing protein n=1 Tax=Petrolisthes cinctipes TaxID=88211 RepID=A0AAE1L1Q2_PETCI|nr:hypothetical protein Pcinc_003024 [Petrolisthes cinctipes]